MSGIKTIEVRIPLKGIAAGKSTVSLETSGFQGATCQDVSSAFTKAIGAVQSEELKPEYYETEERQEHLRNGGASPNG